MPSRMPKSWERYTSLAALIKGECCNYQRGRCLRIVSALGPEAGTDDVCEVLEPGGIPDEWHGPLGVRHPKTGEPREKEWVADGRCSWFEKAILPILPEHVEAEYRQRGADRETGREADRPGAEQRASRDIRHRARDHQRLVRPRP